MTLPIDLRPLFWDVEAETFIPTAYPAYVVERVLELGDERATQWLRATFSSDTIIGVLRRSHRLSARSANFWALVFKVPRDEVNVLSEPHAR